MSTLIQLRELLDNILSYFHKYSTLANFHMVDYLTKNGFEHQIPQEIQEEIKDKGFDYIIAHIFGDKKDNLPHLDEFLLISNRFTLRNCSSFCLGIDDFQSKLQEWGCEKVSRFKLPVFVSSKKSHEVDIVSFIAAAIKDISGTSHLVDIGDGRGYLSSMLSLYYNIPVLGVDASQVNTHSSVERLRKLSRVWNSIVNSSDTIEPKAQLYKQITKFVDENIDFKQLIVNVFLNNPTSLGLVGLHTCGNLAANSLRIFNSSKDIRTICNVGCCYHLIDEKFDPENLRRHGFPMSSYLHEKKIFLGRAARMIAAQSIERILKKKELPNKTIFYRALLEILIEQKCPEFPKDKRTVGRFRKGCGDFKEYVRKAFDRIGFPVSVSDAEIELFYLEYAHREKEMYIFNLIRNMIAPVIESIIMLDRLLYLYENGHINTYLVHLFDPVVSPRCYGIIGMKNV